MTLGHGAARDRDGLESLLSRIVARATDRLPCCGGAIVLVDGYGAVPTILARHGPLAPVDDVLARLTHERRTVLVPGGGADGPPVLGVPMWWDDELLGACVLTGGPGVAPADVATAEGFADQAAAAVMTARLGAAPPAVPVVPPADVHSLLDELDRAERAVDSGLSPAAALRRARRLAQELAAGPAGPAPPAARRLVPAVRAELDRALRVLDARGGVVTMGTERVLDPAVAHRMLEVVRSVLDNVVRHSGAATLRVGLVFDPGAVRLLVEDDGCGFDPAAVTHVGLADAAAGVHRLGGEFEIDSTPGWGTRIRARLPEPPVAAEPARSRPAAAAPPAGVSGNAALTLREREVRELVEQGLADKQIAGRLRISVKTVEKHVGAILRKTGARNRTMLARFGSADHAGRS